MHKNIVIPLLSKFGLFIHICVSINSIVPKDVIFYLLWYNVIRWSSHICKKSSFLSSYSFLVWQSWKNAIMQVIYFLNATTMFKFLSYCYIILYWEKVTSYEKFSHNVTLEVQILLGPNLSAKVSLRSYTDIYWHLHSNCFKNAVLARQQMVQCKCFFLKNLESEKQEHIIYNFKWVEVRKMSEVFWVKLYCKMSDTFR